MDSAAGVGEGAPARGLARERERAREVDRDRDRETDRESARESARDLLSGRVRVLERERERERVGELGGVGVGERYMGILAVLGVAILAIAGCGSRVVKGWIRLLRR